MLIKDLEVRHVRLWELPQLLTFRAAYDYEPYPARRGNGESVIYSLLKFLWHGKRIGTIVVVREGEILGYASMVFGKYKQFRGNMYLVSVAVKDGERGKGLGTLLFKEVEDYARSRGTRRIEFDVFAKNTGALRLYKKLGYEVEGVKRRAAVWEDGHDDLVFMAKLLG